MGIECLSGTTDHDDDRGGFFEVQNGIARWERDGGDSQSEQPIAIKWCSKVGVQSEKTDTETVKKLGEIGALRSKVDSSAVADDAVRMVPKDITFLRIELLLFYHGHWEIFGHVSE